MKINILKVAAFFSGMCALASCTTPELENFDEYSLTEPAKSESYYEALRAFKQSKHPSFFWLVCRMERTGGIDCQHVGGTSRQYGCGISLGRME